MHGQIIRTRIPIFSDDKALATGRCSARQVQPEIGYNTFTVIDSGRGEPGADRRREGVGNVDRVELRRRGTDVDGIQRIRAYRRPDDESSVS